MRKKRKDVLLLLFFFLVFLAVAFSIITPKEIFPLVSGKEGEDSSSGQVLLIILGSENIIIYSPKNITYSFDKSSQSYYFPVSDFLIDLNVSSNFDVDNWSYVLTQTTPTGKTNTFGSGKYFSSWASKLFIPFQAYRWSNEIIVTANGRNGEVESSEPVSFFVFVENSNPWISDLDEEYFVCEGSYLDHIFYFSDIDEDDLNLGIINSNPIYVGQKERINDTSFKGKLTSGRIVKKNIGFDNPGSKEYPITVSVSDGSGVDFKSVAVNLLEVNNPPVSSPVGVQTIWSKGDNSTFNKTFFVNDIEDGNSSSGNLDFDISFFGLEDLFEINEYGEMYFSPEEGFLGEDFSRTYSIEVCATDGGLLNVHPNLTTFCGQNGSKISACEEFTLTVTSENRPPVIKEYFPFPNSNVVAISGEEPLFFNATSYDPDGSIADFYWYVNGELEGYSSGSLDGFFNYTFGCGVSGIQKIIVVATDGLLNDSIEWNINVTEVSCSSWESSSGGSSGGGGEKCLPNWACDDWSICQNVKKSLSDGFLVGNDYRKIKEECTLSGLDDLFCGFQTRNCIDLNSCENYKDIPSQLISCRFSENPSCFDGIKNCHDDGCEIGIDCGGSCSVCPTCSDGILNQGEQGLDCGGPCPWTCPIEHPKKEGLLTIYLVIGLLLILILLILIRIFRIIKYKSESCVDDKEKTN